MEILVGSFFDIRGIDEVVTLKVDFPMVVKDGRDARCIENMAQLHEWADRVFCFWEIREF